ncbi:MAG: PilZ domain-containing protein [Candidatus Omnitrophica bacterium]|nr:PilZ domain-containing protein [Candidatus Omnitrophota bacterium]
MLKIFGKKVAYEDSRAKRRVRAFCLLKYSVLNKMPQKTTVVNPKDISASGTAFICDENLPVNSMLEVDIYMPPLKDFITVMASVVWVSKIKDTERFVVGVRFTAMDQEEKMRLNSYIAKLSKDPTMHPYLDRKARRFKRQNL